MYWDQVFLADRPPDTPHRVTKLIPSGADLHYGGYARLYRPADDGPHLYDYEQKTFAPVWLDMTGMVTRPPSSSAVAAVASASSTVT